MANYKITIPEPCHEKWADMSATERGAFCQSCKKEVIDFTDLTATELGDYLKRNSTLSCGRFTPMQLKARYTIAEDKPTRKIFYKGWVAAIISLFLSLINSKTEAKNIAPSIEWVDKNEVDNLLPVGEEPVDTNDVFISGIVTDEAGKGLQSVALYLNDKPIGLSDANGNFKLKVPQELKGRKITISARFLGYEVTNQKLGVVRNNSTVNLKMVMHYAFMGVMIMEVEEEPQLPITPEESKVFWGVKYGIWD